VTCLRTRATTKSRPVSARTASTVPSASVMGAPAVAEGERAGVRDCREEARGVLEVVVGVGGLVDLSNCTDLGDLLGVRLGGVRFGDTGVILGDSGGDVGE
jgi:hypothetical protein